MFTYTFQILFTVCALGTMVVAVLTHRYDRRMSIERADRAFLMANDFIDRRLEEGYYQPFEIGLMKRDFDAKYIELISQ